MVQRRQSRLFSAKPQAGHTHASVVGSSAMMDIFFFRRLYRLESFDTSEPSIAKATSNKCEVGMARKCVSAHLRSAWQQKPGVMHRYAKDTILKKLFPPVLLRICVSVCELKKSQPKRSTYVVRRFWEVVASWVTYGSTRLIGTILQIIEARELDPPLIFALYHSDTCTNAQQKLL